MNAFSSSHLVLAGLVQYVQGLHGYSLAVVVKLCDQQLHAPATEELHTRSQQHAQVLGGIQSADLLRGIVRERGDMIMPVLMETPKALQCDMKCFKQS